MASLRAGAAHQCASLPLWGQNTFGSDVVSRPAGWHGQPVTQTCEVPHPLCLCWTLPCALAFAADQCTRPHFWQLTHARADVSTSVVSSKAKSTLSSTVLPVPRTWHERGTNVVGSMQKNGKAHNTAHAGEFGLGRRKQRQQDGDSECQVPMPVGRPLQNGQKLQN
eukprot:3177752-Prymnesium_polylepis.1